MPWAPVQGCGIVVELARRVAGRCRLLVVSGDPRVTALFQGMANVEVSARQAGWRLLHMI